MQIIRYRPLRLGRETTRTFTTKKGVVAAAQAKAKMPLQYRIPFPRRQPSEIERKPKVIVAAMAFGVSAATISSIFYFESLKYGEMEMSTLPSASSSDSSSKVIEPVTGTAFPVNLFGYETTSSVHWLVGSSVRCMMNFCSFERARAYAYGLYISQESLEKLRLSSNQHPEDITEESLRGFLMPREPIELESQMKRKESLKAAVPFIHSKSFVGRKDGYVFKRDKDGLGYYLDKQGEAIREMKGTEKYPSSVLRLIMLRDVKTDHVAHGFDRTLLWRIRDLQNEEKQGPGKEALRKFTDFLRRQKEWKKGTILDLVRLPHGMVSVRVDGVEGILLHSEMLSYAILDAYYGPKGHFSAACKEDLIERTREIITVL
eukprot:CAMPEP_0204894298 /NCGR_PEP_ID=MMETSP1349-20130617/33347_1 /ASSEMBLY_ACC=CAM_ASM_000710 /TAXON_ID=215587 /ORGANISM="Aplanochytrium stocchinoi, Strain GSBS06" /LENGTH=373 /DNA_ID=CAMNT_0052061457 /DNA_START=1 /DNA_END=1122 /DNA_ORIENTATION=+